MSNNNLVIKPRHSRGDDGYRVFSVRVKEEILNQIETIAVETGRSRNELIGILLEYAVSHCTIEK